MVVSGINIEDAGRGALYLAQTLTTGKRSLTKTSGEIEERRDNFVT
jgi:hypothetical protein